MSQRSESSDSTEWPEWRREWERARPQLGEWVSRGQEWARERQQPAAPRSRPAAFAHGLLMLPLNLAAGALGLIAGAMAALAGLLILLLGAWIVMGVIGAVMAGGRGWDVRLGWVLGFGLGPIGVALTRLLPARR